MHLESPSLFKFGLSLPLTVKNKPCGPSVWVVESDLQSCRRFSIPAGIVQAAPSSASVAQRQFQKGTPKWFVFPAGWNKDWTRNTRVYWLSHYFSRCFCIRFILQYTPVQLRPLIPFKSRYLIDVYLKSMWLHVSKFVKLQGRKSETLANTFTTKDRLAGTAGRIPKKIT
jgi:hypothetical protein